MGKSNEVVKGHDPDKFCQYCGAGEGYAHGYNCPTLAANIAAEAAARHKVPVARSNTESVHEIHVVYRVRDCLPLIAFTDNKAAWDDAAEQHAHNPGTAYSVHTINLVDGGE